LKLIAFLFAKELSPEMSEKILKVHRKIKHFAFVLHQSATLASVVFFYINIFYVDGIYEWSIEFIILYGPALVLCTLYVVYGKYLKMI